MNKSIIIGLIALALVVGVGAGSYLRISNADAQVIQTAEVKPAQEKTDLSNGQHTANGITEEILTGDSAEKAKAVALKAVPDGTILKVETDAEGDVYEAHMQKADGSYITVKFDENFNVTKTEEGFAGKKPSSV